ncbi:LacI family DNA-binding transcriptional regulator [Pedococcus sp. 5OH_020]|uniref:LacI family DNA-binding transcriptional regulator n=1 Tax=Pedococcus sp. 5OH_020 TaxID=2989814 RepID=UPI0022E9D124|nr:LacI family DNA-binding transcriptional regulator [Pedococcus sp. 5OH_020]
MTVTLADVAEQAGVSIATASRVVNGSTRVVGEELRAKVLATATALGYRANPHAQAVARGSSTVAGLVIHDITDPYFSAIAAGALEVAESRGLIVSLGTSVGGVERELEHVSLLRAQRARGLILVGSRTSNRQRTRALAAELAAFTSEGGRVSCVSQNRLGVDTVVPENRAGAAALANHVLDLGHRELGILAGPANLLTASDRARGFKGEVERRGARARVFASDFTWEGGFEAATQAAQAASRPTCLLAVNDVMAMGALAALRCLGLSVPWEVSVAGFDDVPALRDVLPALTTVRLPLTEMGRQAARLAFVAEPSAHPRITRVSGEVVVRDSTAPPPA